MVSFQLESDAEVRSPRFTCGIKIAHAMDRADSLLVSLLFGNHFVVELLWPCRERRARMIIMVEFKIFNLLSMNSNTGIRCRGYSPRFIYGIKAACAMDRADSRYLNLLFDIAGGEAKLWCDSVLDPSSSMIKCYLKKKVKDQNQVQRLQALVSFME